MLVRRASLSERDRAIVCGVWRVKGGGQVALRFECGLEDDVGASIAQSFDVWRRRQPCRFHSYHGHYRDEVSASHQSNLAHLSGKSEEHGDIGPHGDHVRVNDSRRRPLT
jgi:hypothetical protein